MDLTTVTFTGLITLGAVNVVTMFKPDIDSRIKFALALAVAFGLTFVPTDVGNMLLDKAKIAIEIAFASSGAYKLATKAGGS